MDTSFSFTPLWEEKAIIYKPEKALHALEKKIYAAILRSKLLPKSGEVFLTPEVLRVVSAVAKHMLLNLGIDNEVLSKIRTTAVKLVPGHSTFYLIDACLVAWYIEAAQVIYAHNDARRIASGPTRPSAWIAGYTNERPMANLGFMSMLAGCRDADVPEHPKLRAASLVSKATVAVLYTAYTMGPHLKDFPWERLEDMPVLSAVDLYLKVFISSCGSIHSTKPTVAPPPAFEYSVTQDDVRISKCGRKLMIKSQGNEIWHRAPKWHPYIKLPGSPWNNFIRNRKQPIFLEGTGHSNYCESESADSGSESGSPSGFAPEPENAESEHSESDEVTIKYKLPSSALTIFRQFEDQYSAAREELDLNHPGTRRVLSERAAIRQYNRFARLSGRKYAKECPDDASAVYLTDAEEAFLYYSPVIQKPRADAAGNLGLPFMSTTVHSVGAHDDPEEPDDGFFIMTYKQ
ncbi:mating type 1-1-2 [Fusarium sporotrichioides]|uniref:Mating type 1-1-2 n=1 Tax=Fusarium sporotrichioides TaxID=5514 RepID=A0A395RZA5_FUSSP|nr:mating type 1-1-2 [Fusarium sporotrichioides]